MLPITGGYDRLITIQEALVKSDIDLVMRRKKSGRNTQYRRRAHVLPQHVLSFDLNCLIF